MNKKWLTIFIVTLFTFSIVQADICRAADKKQTKEQSAEKKDSVKEDKADSNGSSIKMLLSIIDLKKDLGKRISEKKAAIKKSKSDAEKAALTDELGKLDKQLAQANIDFERMATGIDTSLFEETEDVPFDWKDEVVALLKPGIMELKNLTAKARYKTQLQEELSSYKKLQPVANQANQNLKALIDAVQDQTAKKTLKRLIPEWESIESQISNRMEIIQLELDKIEAEKKSLIETSQESIKNFFKTRGLYMTIAILACAGLILLLRLLRRSLKRSLPGYYTPYRPFHIRAVDLGLQIFTLVSSLFVLVLVFYIFEDWVLLSLCIVILLGLGWAAKTTLPKYWAQSRLMLNLGAVREGERVMIDGIPWLVKNINMYSTLENPDLGMKLRIPIENLLDKTSRTYDKKESWFPCRRDDWVILADGTRGHVVSLSHEMVELVLRGGARKVYQTQDFLGQSPLNLSVNFRIKTLFGISYDLQAISTTTVLKTMEAFINEQIEKEGYEDKMLNLRVEFAQAGGSSLDLVVITDFKGEMAPLYNRLRRAVQRWCTDACTQNNWDIPFPQLTVHKASIG